MVTSRDRLTKPLKKVFDPKKSKLLILGTMPAYGRNWYYQDNDIFWEIMSEALDNPKLSQLSTTDRERKEILLESGVALWDIFAYGWRKNGSINDKDIIFQKGYAPTPNKIYEEIISQGNVDFIIINGLEQALEWFIEYNQEEEIKQMMSAGKIKSLHQTKYIQTSKPEDHGYRQRWINTIRKALGKSETIKRTTSTKTSSTAKSTSSTKQKTQSTSLNKVTNTNTTKTKKLAFVVKKDKKD